jgi:hypothetical protein
LPLGSEPPRWLVAFKYSVLLVLRMSRVFQAAYFSARNILIYGTIFASTALAGGEARAQDIDTASSWNGSEGICCWAYLAPKHMASS